VRPKGTTNGLSLPVEISSPLKRVVYFKAGHYIHIQGY